MYTDDLLALDACKPLDYQQSPPPSLLKVSTPLNVPAWSAALSTHPDQPYARFILAGLTQGYRIGFDRAHPLQSASKNMQSARANAQVVEDYLMQERSHSRFVGPLPPSCPIHTSRIGVIPKGHTPGKWRLITDFSFPPDFRINDGIERNLCSLSYVTVDCIAGIVEALGQASQMVIMDIESAYRLIPVHPDDRVLLGVQWNGETLADTRLPLRLHSVPKLFKRGRRWA